MIAYRDIQNKVAEFLADELTLPALQNWIAPAAWGWSKNPDSAEAHLLYKLELKISEYDAGHLPRADFVNELKQLAAGAVTATSGASGSIEASEPRVPFTPASAIERIQFSEVCAS